MAWLRAQKRGAAIRVMLGAALLLAPAVGRASPAADPRGPSGQCEDAIRSAERRYQLPPGLLFAIGLTETGRSDPRTSRLRPWPWSVQANDAGHFFATKAEAVRWVRNAQANGTASIDTGCLQVNLLFHPRAFQTVDFAFDPRRNVDYAARFLVQLHAATNEWWQATGFYHSHTPALAASYRQRVQYAMKLGPAVGTNQPVSLVAELGAAWGATIAPRAPEQHEGRSWDSLLGAGDDVGTPDAGATAETIHDAARQPQVG